ncbi:MAG: hypothetical protein RBT59_13230 [Arcobacteraceae bacterium]|jgi:uncharacterized membrane protein YesL|nr:hypothetical protein [Arcobacteraceae bacterium]
MDKTEIGLIVFGSIAGLVVLFAVILAKGKKYAQEDEAKKKADFKKSFLKVKPPQ